MLPVKPSPEASLPDASDARSTQGPAARRISSEQLLGTAGHAVIVHRGREYRLRETQNGKLILTA